jgi:hypothetical protein
MTRYSSAGSGRCRGLRLAKYATCLLGLLLADLILTASPASAAPPR